MRTVRRVRATVAAILVVAVVSIVAACSSPASSPSAAPSPTGPLVTVELRGGMCASAPCGTTIYLERDGRVHQAAKPPNDLGTVPLAALAALDAAIRTTDFAALKGHPFTGQCPTAYDGQEIVFEFGAAGGVERIASCEVEVDFSRPLFVTVATALEPFISLPTR